MTTALVLRHDSAIGLGNLEGTLRENGYELRIVDAPVSDVAAIDPLGPELVVVLGGEEGAYETERFPYLADEIALLRARIAAEAPVFGVCLGAQLLAAALGARVYPGARKEVGWLTVQPTDAGERSPVRHFDGVRAVQWHGDSFDLPAGATRLATSPQYENQAFAIGDWLLAVQFHPEVTAEIHEDWVRAWGHELPGHGLTADGVRAGRALYCAPMQSASRALLGEFLAGLPADQRRSAKKSRRSAAHSSSSTPA